MPIIQLQDVESSQIHSIGHDPETNVLAVRFYRGLGDNRRPGAIYHFQNVGAQEFAALRDADSIGRHFNQTIKPFPAKYPFAKVSDGDDDQAAAAA
jgi:hypothetical protein